MEQEINKNTCNWLCFARKKNRILVFLYCFFTLSCSSTIPENERIPFISYKNPLGDFIEKSFPESDSGRAKILFRLRFDDGDVICRVDTSLELENLICQYESSGEVFSKGTLIDSMYEGLLYRFDKQGRIIDQRNYVHNIPIGGSSIFDSGGNLYKYGFVSFESQKMIFYLEQRNGKYNIIKKVELPLIILQDKEEPYSIGEKHSLNFWAANPPGLNSKLFICVDSSLQNCKQLTRNDLYKELFIYTFSAESPGVQNIKLGYVLIDEDKDTLIRGFADIDLEFK